MPKKILIADDEDTAREFAAYLLKQHGYEPIEAADGAELLKKAGEHLPDLILTDILMPGISGYTAVEHIRSIKQLKNTPVIFCSGVMKDRETFHTLKPSGPCDFISKPFDRELLLQKIQSFIS